MRQRYERGQMQDHEAGAWGQETSAGQGERRRSSEQVHCKGCAIAGGTPRRHAQEQDAGAGAREMCRDGGQVHVPDAGIRA